MPLLTIEYNSNLLLLIPLLTEQTSKSSDFFRRMLGYPTSRLPRLASSTCHERIKILESSGVIRGAHADVDLRAVGLTLEALFFIELAKHGRTVVDRFMNETESIPDVRRTFLVSGHYDLIVQ